MIHAITGVATSVTAFIGRAQQGPVDEPRRVASFGEFEREFGGLWRESRMSYAVQQYFLNGGREALIVRVDNGALDIGDEQVATGASLETERKGLWALEKADLVNLLCIPPYTEQADVGRATWDAAVRYGRRRRAMVLVDPPAAWSAPAQVVASSGLETLVTRHENAAVFFPRLQTIDPLGGDAPASFAPSGAVAGVMARTDAQRGVWKAAAGKDAALAGVSGLSVNLSASDTASLNALGVNCLRQFPGIGPVVWGTRTLAGDGPSEWKYIPVRRLALFIEESVLRGTVWVASEPNGEALWAQVRLSVRAFMQTLFLQGALQGVVPDDAYFVKCDAETTPPSDTLLGVVNILIGFAPVRPAEFVVIEIQQRARAASA